MTEKSKNDDMQALMNSNRTLREALSIAKMQIKTLKTEIRELRTYITNNMSRSNNGKEQHSS